MAIGYSSCSSSLTKISSVAQLCSEFHGLPANESTFKLPLATTGDGTKCLRPRSLSCSSALVAHDVIHTCHSSDCCAWRRHGLTGFAAQQNSLLHTKPSSFLLVSHSSLETHISDFYPRHYPFSWGYYALSDTDTDFGGLHNVGKQAYSLVLEDGKSDSQAGAGARSFLSECIEDETKFVKHSPALEDQEKVMRESTGANESIEGTTNKKLELLCQGDVACTHRSSSPRDSVRSGRSNRTICRSSSAPSVQSGSDIASLSSLFTRNGARMITRSTVAAQPLLISRPIKGPSGVMMTAAVAVAGIATLLKKRSPGSAHLDLEYCRKCEGQGEEVCPICAGLGEIMWEGKLFHRNPCPACIGSGCKKCSICKGHRLMPKSASP